MRGTGIVLIKKALRRLFQFAEKCTCLCRMRVNALSGQQKLKFNKLQELRKPDKHYASGKLTHLHSPLPFQPFAHEEQRAELRASLKSGASSKSIICASGRAPVVAALAHRLPVIPGRDLRYHDIHFAGKVRRCHAELLQKVRSFAPNPTSSFSSRLAA